MKIKTIWILLGLVLVALLIPAIVYLQLFSASQPNSPQESTFIVPQGAKDAVTINQMLEQGFIKSPWAFNLVRFLKGYGHIPPGGYNISKSENVWQIAYQLTSQPPDMKWLTIPEGWRKEQIGEKLATELNWSPEDLSDWNEKYTRMRYDYIEGVYFPDTYLIPASEKNFEAAQRLINRFNEKFAGYPEKFAQKDILWTTGLKVASLIQRETANPADMPVISGIIWNRLQSGIRLQIDATLQYAKGKTDGQWWGTVTPTDKRLDSPYNTYLNRGLPPTPICNPGLDAIAAALNPATTDCIFYLHDKSGLMHCATTYAEHLENISEFLK
jgi:UPF0755 protein